MEDWNAADVIVWLEEMELLDFKDVFYSSGFEGRDLLALNGEAFGAVASISAERRRVMDQHLRDLRAHPTGFIQPSLAGPPATSVSATSAAAAEPVKWARALYAFNPAPGTTGQLALEVNALVRNGIGSSEDGVFRVLSHAFLRAVHGAEQREKVVARAQQQRRYGPRAVQLPAAARPRRE